MSSTLTAKEKQRIRSKKHYENNKESYLYRARKKRNYDKAKLTPAELIFNRTKGTSKQRGIPFDLEIEDIIVPEVCPYTGLTLCFGTGHPQRNSYSLDRIDNTLGYVKGNVEVISYLANRMKQDASVGEQIRFAKEVLRRYEVS